MCCMGQRAHLHLDSLCFETAAWPVSRLSCGGVQGWVLIETEREGEGVCDGD